MVMSWIWVGILTVSLFFSIVNGQGSALAAAIPQGAQAGITLALSIAGPICLWCGIGTLMEKAGLMQRLTMLLRPLLGKLFPTSKRDPVFANRLSANFCANLLGLGNAATPMGIQAVKRLKDPKNPELATDEMCRLIVLNTASIQLIPANVAAVRASLGCNAPFDILPAVWLTSICSASLGVLTAWCLGKLWRHG